MGAGASTPTRRSTEPPRRFQPLNDGVVDSDIKSYSASHSHPLSSPTSLFRLPDKRLRSLATLAYRTYPALRDPSLWKHVYHESSKLPTKVIQAVSSQLQEGQMCRRKIARKLSQQIFVTTGDDDDKKPPPRTAPPSSPPPSKIQEAARRSSIRRQFHASRHMRKSSKRGFHLKAVKSFRISKSKTKSTTTNRRSRARGNTDLDVLARHGRQNSNKKSSHHNISNPNQDALLWAIAVVMHAQIIPTKNRKRTAEEKLRGRYIAFAEDEDVDVCLVIISVSLSLKCEHTHTHIHTYTDTRRSKYCKKLDFTFSQACTT